MSEGRLTTNDVPPPEQPSTEPPPTGPTVDPTPEASVEQTADGDLASERGTELRTFLIADIRGYTTYTSEFGDAAAARLVGRFSAMVREVVEAREGFLLELRGDEALVVFVSARQALRAATELQRRFDAEGMPRGVGIGLDAGEAIPVDDGYRGTSLNVAARLCAQAGPGEILASETVIHLAAKVDGIDYIDPRTLRLKGLDEPVRAVAVVRTDQPKSGRRQRRPRSGGVDRRILAGLGVAGLVVVIGAGALLVGPLSGGGSASPTPSGSGDAAAASPTPTPSLVAGAAAISADDLPLLAFLDPESGAVEEVLREPTDGVEAIFADGDFWVLDRKPRAIHQVDPETGKVGTVIALGHEVGSFTVGDGRVYVAELANRIHVYDAATGVQVDEFNLNSSEALGSYDWPLVDLAVGAGSLWVAADWIGVVRVDPATGDVDNTFNLFTAGRYAGGHGIAFADGAAWVIDGWGGQVIRIDSATNDVEHLATIKPGIGPLVAGASSAWVASAADGTVTRVDELGLMTPYTVGGGIDSLAFDDASGRIWATSREGGTITSIDAVTTLVNTATLGHAASPISAGGGRLLAGITRTPAEAVAALPGEVLRIATDDRFDATDPAYGWRSESRRQLDRLTCARLLEYGPAEGSGVPTFVPVVAAALPELSADGRTYTFTIREGFRFSPPSDEPLTADVYRASLERALSSEFENDGSGFRFMTDVEGVYDYRDGRAEHVTGITAEGNRLSIRLTRPSATFLHRLWQGWFCPVPSGTPAAFGGQNDPQIASLGPYYITQNEPGEVMILERNPGWGGPPTGGFDTIAWFSEANLGRAIGRVERGEIDYTAGYGSELRLGSRTDERWGPTSDAAAGGDQRLFHRPGFGADFLTVNPGSQVMADEAVRRAVNLAIDRPALAGYWGGVPTDDVLPASMPGRVDEDRFPLDGAHTDEAIAALGGRSVSLRIAWPAPSDCDVCPAVGEALRQQLAAAGITATLELSEAPNLFASGLDSGYDLAYGNASIDIPDAAEWLDEALSETRVSVSNSFEAGFPGQWVPDDIEAERRHVVTLDGEERVSAASALARRVADQMMLIPLTDGDYSQLVAERIGCLDQPSPWPELDPLTLCLD